MLEFCTNHSLKYDNEESHMEVVRDFCLNLSSQIRMFIQANPDDVTGDFSPVNRRGSWNKTGKASNGSYELFSPSPYA